MKIDILSKAASIQNIEAERNRLKRILIIIRIILCIAVIALAFVCTNYLMDFSPILGNENDDHSAHSYGAIYFLIFFVVVAMIIKKMDSIILEIKQFDIADRETCLQIIEWKQIPEIETFVHSVVVDQSRKFTVAEFNAMKVYFYSKNEKIEAEKREKEIENSCRDVYGLTDNNVENVKPVER